MCVDFDSGRGCVIMSKAPRENNICVAGKCRKVEHGMVRQATDEKWVPPMEPNTCALMYERLPNAALSSVHSCFESLADVFVYMVSTGDERVIS